ncbi:MAG: hypothetical protein Q7S96_01025 [bacterium]|nr:hypothetical protein [bacterium]
MRRIFSIITTVLLFAASCSEDRVEEREFEHTTIHAVVAPTPTPAAQPCTVETALEAFPRAMDGITAARDERARRYVEDDAAMVAAGRAITPQPRIKMPTTPPVAATIEHVGYDLKAEQFSGSCALREDVDTRRTLGTTTLDLTDNWPGIIALVGSTFNAVIARETRARWNTIDADAKGIYGFVIFTARHLEHGAARALVHATLGAIDADSMVATAFISWAIREFQAATTENANQVRIDIEAYLKAAEEANMIPIHADRLIAETEEDSWDNAGTPTGMLYRLWLPVFQSAGTEKADARLLRIRFVLVRALAAYDPMNAPLRAAVLSTDVRAASNATLSEKERTFLLSQLAIIPPFQATTPAPAAVVPAGEWR